MLSGVLVKSQRHRDTHGRVWEVALVPVEEAAEADADALRERDPHGRAHAPDMLVGGVEPRAVLGRGE
jgi:hypothetical protein